MERDEEKRLEDVLRTSRELLDEAASARQMVRFSQSLNRIDDAYELTIRVTADDHVVLRDVDGNSLSAPRLTDATRALETRLAVSLTIAIEAALEQFAETVNDEYAAALYAAAGEVKPSSDIQTTRTPRKIRLPPEEQVAAIVEGTAGNTPSGPEDPAPPGREIPF